MDEVDDLHTYYKIVYSSVWSFEEADVWHMYLLWDSLFHWGVQGRDGRGTFFDTDFCRGESIIYCWTAFEEPDNECYEKVFSGVRQEADGEEPADELDNL